MKVRFAAFARYAETEPETGLLNLTGAGASVFGVESVPVTIPTYFALLLGFEEDEVGQEREIRPVLRLGTGQLDVVQRPEPFTITPRLGEYHAPGWEGAYAITGILDMAIQEPGAYYLDLHIDDAEESAGSIPFQVILAA